MKCQKCGKENDSEATFCSECGSKLKEEKVVKEAATQKPSEEKRIISSLNNDTFFCLLSLICLVLPTFAILLDYILGINFFKTISSLCPLASLGLCIYARVHYPNSKFAKILLIVYIVMIILGIIGLVFIIFTCVRVIQSCSGSSFGLIFYGLK